MYKYVLEPCCLPSKTLCMDCELPVCEDHMGTCHPCHSAVCSLCFKENHGDCHSLAFCTRAQCTENEWTGCNHCFERICPCNTVRTMIQCGAHNKRHVFCSSFKCTMYHRLICPAGSIEQESADQGLGINNSTSQQDVHCGSPRRPVPRKDCCFARACQVFRGKVRLAARSNRDHDPTLPAEVTL